MSGTTKGGKRAAITNKQRDEEYLAKYGMTFYQYIGSLGGKNGTTGGFASKKIGADGLDGKTRASVVGSIGGKKSKRGPTPKQVQAAKRYEKKVMSFEPTHKRKSFLDMFKVGV